MRLLTAADWVQGVGEVLVVAMMSPHHTPWDDHRDPGAHIPGPRPPAD